MDQLQRLLTLDEGYRLRLYTDTVGKVSVGIGHNLSDNGISDAVAQLLYDEDIKAAQAILTNLYPEWPILDPVRQAVFLDLAFNLGPKLGEFKDLLSYAKAGVWEAVARALQDSLWFRQVGARGPRLAQMLLTAEWPSELR